MHPITGIKNKLLSYYEFLKKYHETYNRKIVLVQYCLPIFENKDKYVN